MSSPMRVLLSLLLFACGSAPIAEPETAATVDDTPGPWAEHPDLMRLPIPIESAPGEGAEQPTVTIIVFSDFECPFCRQAVPVLDQAQSAHPEDVRVHFRHMPLPFHEHAQLAAEAAEEARAQGGAEAFFRYHDRLFETQELELDALIAHATELGLDADRFRVALRGRVHQERVAADAEFARRIGIEGTPTLFINGRPFVGVPPPEDLEAMIVEEIGIAREAMTRGIERRDLYPRMLVDATALVRARIRQMEEEQNRELDPTVVYAIPADDAPAIGPADARVTIVTFSDFQCPFCADAVATLHELRDRHPDDLRIVFRHNPLSFHRHARDAARAAIAVREARGDAAFWEMHDRLFANQDALTQEDLVGHAAAVGVDIAAALESEAHEDVLERDHEIARRFGVTSTPIFFVNGRLVAGAQPLGVFDAVFTEALERAQAAIDRGVPRSRVYSGVLEGASNEAVWRTVADVDTEEESP
jgi:protein-disulfide isomerase